MDDVYSKDPLNPNVPALQEQGRMEATKAYVNSMVWYLETMIERGTKKAMLRDDNGNPVEERRYVSMRRFSPGVPYASVRAVLDALSDVEAVVDPLVSGHTEPGKWRVKSTFYRKDSRYERVDAKDATATIVQDLVPYNAKGDDEDFFGGGNCRSEREYHYVWEATSVEAPKPEVGETIAIQSVSRDDDTGLFNYVVVKEIAQPQHIDPYVSRRSYKSITTTEQWINYRYEDLDDDLKRHANTEYEDKEQGVTIEISLNKNEDCTYNAVRQITSEGEAGNAVADGKTLTKHEHSETKVRQKEALGDAPAASGGVYYTHQSRLEDDGTFTTTEAKTTEKGVACYTEQHSKTRDGTRIEVSAKNQASAPSFDNLNIGETVKYQRTEGGLYDIERVCVCVAEDTNLGFTYEENIYGKCESTTTVKKDKGDEVSCVCNGTLTSKSYAQTDLGTWQETTTKETENEVKCSRVAKTLTLDGTTIQTSHCHLQPDDTLAVKEPTNIGDQIVVAKTEGGLVDVTISKLDTDSFKERCIQRSKADTIFEKQSSVTCISKDAIDVCGTPAAVGGKIYSRSACLTETGTYRNTETLKEEKPVSDSEVATSKTAWATVEQKTNRNQTNPIDPGSVKLGTVRNCKTEGGLYNTTVVTTSAASCSWGYTQSQDEFRKVVVTQFRGQKDKWNAPMYGQAEVSMDESTGSYEGHKVEITPIASCYERSKKQDADTITVGGIDKNCHTSYFNGREGSLVTAYKKGISVATSSRKTSEGRYDVSWQEEKPGEYWEEKYSFEESDGEVYVFVYGNSKDPIPASVKSDVKGWLDTDNRSTSVSPNISRDRFGYWSGSFTVRTRKSTGSGESGDELLDDSKFETEKRAVVSQVVNGETVYSEYSAIRVDGYDSSIGSAHKEITDKHDKTAQTIDPSWGNCFTRHRERGRAQWGAFYWYHKDVKLERQYKIQTGTDGKPSEVVISPKDKGGK